MDVINIKTEIIKEETIEELKAQHEEVAAEIAIEQLEKIEKEQVIELVEPIVESKPVSAPIALDRHGNPKVKVHARGR